MGSRDWMSRVSNETLLSQLSIPGTHDSHCIRENLPYAMRTDLTPASVAAVAMTQGMGITSQLRAGVRYLDLRVGEDKRMRHGKIRLEGSFEDCVKEIHEFLRENSSETVLVAVMWDHDGVEEPEWFTKYVGEQWYFKGWASADEWYKLGDVRGRACLLRRFKPNPNSPQLGVDITELFGHDDHRHGRGQWHSRPMGNEGGGEYSHKWDLAYQHLETAKLWPKENVLWLTNLAGFEFEWGSIGFPLDYAKNMNAKLREYLRGLQGTQRLGVIQLDFIKEEDCALIYGKNFS